MGKEVHTLQQKWIKSLIVWKGIIIGFGFHTLVCEQGYLQVDKVRFDQVNSAAIGGVDHFMRQHSVNEEEDIW